MTKMLFVLTFESESWVISVFLADLEAAVLLKCQYIILLILKPTHRR